MNTKRLGTRITASFETLVAKLENHRVLADSKIQTVKKTAVKVSTHLGLTRYRLQKLLKREAELASSIQRWRLRAVRQSKIDQNKALRCVQALNKSQELLDQIRTQLSLERRLESDLQVYLTEIQGSLNQLEIQREKLIAKEGAAEVYQNTLPLFSDQGVDGGNSPWGKNLNINAYYESPINAAKDELPSGFKDQQHHEKLHRQLSDICRDAAQIKRNDDGSEA